MVVVSVMVITELVMNRSSMSHVLEFNVRHLFGIVVNQVVFERNVGLDFNVVLFYFVRDVVSLILYLSHFYLVVNGSGMCSRFVEYSLVGEFLAIHGSFGSFVSVSSRDSILHFTAKGDF